MNAARAVVRKQTMISIIITMAISAAFFLLVFGDTDPIAVWAPDNLALDFLPQSGLASFMAALMPALQARSAIASGTLPGPVPTIKSIAYQAAFLALLGLALAASVIELLKLSGVAFVAWSSALAIKVAYGALLGLIVTPLALRAVITRG